ncbi:integral membrane protein GPR137B-like isoform X1 [Scleropages formosus]|uniref:integral membrane protein GPR137B-like isoform X1 n=1 Tax=Scleropages formosus TaxID=113540 RepID=UPI0010FA81A4|nr:integral membrane protein GPR137B isoform X1 [Scleropages formosus]
MEPPGNESLPPPPTLSPAVPPYVKLGLTVAYTIFYSVLFAFVYAQLWLVLRYRHKRLSYQTVFLFLCLLWAALRAVLFSFYFRSFVTANALGPFSFWLLYCFPVCLQFFTLSLMNLYFAQVVFKAKSKYSPELFKYRIAKMSLANIYLESKGTSVCQVTVIGVTVILLYTSRACYNLVVLGLTNIKSINSFDYDWYNVSDQADLKSNLGDAGYIVFGVVLFVWELLPTSLVVFFFRVRRPMQDKSGSRIPGHLFSSRGYFFDNPRRYDSDDNLAWSIIPQGVQTSLPTESYDWGTQSTGIVTYIGTEELHPAAASGQLDPY